MTGDEIFLILQDGSERWGGTQPSIFWATALLEELPVKSLWCSGPDLHISFSRKLAGLEWLALGSLDADETTSDGLDVRLWWD